MERWVGLANLTAQHRALLVPQTDDRAALDLTVADIGCSLAIYAGGTAETETQRSLTPTRAPWNGIELGCDQNSRRSVRALFPLLAPNATAVGEAIEF